MKSEFIPRSKLSDAIQDSLHRYPVTALLGPRQVGKSTLARLFNSRPENHFDLESPIDLARLEPDSYGLLSSLEGIVLIDEIQQMPELFAHLRVIVDEPLCRAKFLVTGSASPDLLAHSAESLAGRIRFIEIGGFNVSEVGVSQWESLWFRGGFPRSFLADDERESREWVEDFLKTYVMKDIQYLAGGGLSPQTLARFLMLLAHYHGQFWNQKDVAATLGVDVKTVQRYLDILAGAYIVRLLPPLEKNVGKRIRKANRLYFRDTGMLHRLLRIRDMAGLRNHDRIGASWEGFAMEQIIQTLDLSSNDCYFWRTHAGSEVDLITQTSEGLIGFEFKSSRSPSVTKGTHEAVQDLNILKLYVIYPGDKSFPVTDRIQALPLSKIPLLINEIRP